MNHQLEEINEMNEFTKGQVVKHEGLEFWFDKVSGRGGNGEYAFIQQKGVKNLKYKQVKISELVAA